MKLAVPRQIEPGETRVPLTPATVKKLAALGAQVLIDAGIAATAYYDDRAYEQSGAAMVTNGDGDVSNLWSEADVVVTIQPPTPTQIAAMRPKSILIGVLDPFRNLRTVEALAAHGVTTFAMELVPRISRAQAMDVLSSQANIAGYEAAIIAAEACPKIFPMMITAAGTIAPSRVFVIGAGVAGLQAIATAKRLGAVVEAYDVRPEVEQQIRSLGARFVKLASAPNGASGAGGYASEQTEDERAQQTQLMARHVVAADAVITTAAVFGKPPPILIPADVVAAKKPGSIIVDLAADKHTGRGNCELTKPDQRIKTPNGVVIEGATNLPARAPIHSSQVYANNMFAFLQQIIDNGQIKLDLDDEIQAGALLTHNGQVTNQNVKQTIEEKSK